MRIANNPAAIAQWQEATEGVGSIRQYYSELLLKNIDVKPSRESSVLNISYTGTDPRFAALVANGFATAYIDTNIEIKVEPAKQNRGFFDEQTQALRDRLEAAQGRLTAYQRDKGIVSADERLDVENARLSDLSSQLTILQSQAVETGQREQSALAAVRDSRSQDVQEVLASPMVQQLKVDLARLEGKLKEQGATLGSNHPELLKMREEAASLRARIDGEASVIAASLGKQHQVVLKREQELRASLEKQRAKVLQLKQVRDELSVLQREVENAQRSFETVAQRLTQTSLESQSNQGNIVLLNAANEPRKPSSPNLLLNSALGAFLGTLLGVGGALGAELRSRRIRSVADLAQSSELPVIGSVRRLSDKLKHAPRRMTQSGLPLLDTEHSENTIMVDPDAELQETVHAGAPSVAQPRNGMVSVPPATVRRKKRIGEILVDAGLLSPDSIEPILEGARAESGLRFGEVAVAQRRLSEAQVRQALAFQFDFPVLTPGASRVSGEVLTAYEGKHPLAADLRKLRTQVHARWLRHQAEQWPPRRAVAVISPNRGDGKSFVAANLAVTFSQMGEKTLLIDADLRRGRVHELLGMDNKVGLTALLNSQNPLGALRRVEGLRDLTVITSGSEAPNPSDLLSRELFALLLASFSKDYDVIIVDTPNAAEEPDAEIVARCTQACVIVGRTGNTQFDGVTSLTQLMASLEVAVIGAVYVEA
jgi:chain length determinant protein tyrosine kinase EpsG